ncbi:hypothetical protein [Archangium lansingense]|uniref:Uncharacterized protein n=1 Tax=Archangium lansingense TaxID=2995310 RepID=A0ABT4A618_9BACT|nr:hypothetical protein [Archangium lansinium]MCY1077090.1 hypothetical protein [Archangium lansinium]
MTSTRTWKGILEWLRRLLWVVLLSGATVHAQTSPPPPNDDFDSAMGVSAFPFTAQLDTRGATAASDDPLNCFGSLGATVWYKITPTENVALAATAEGSSYPVVLGVFTGSRGNLTPAEPVSCVFPVPGARLVFDAVAGQTYFLLVGTPNGGGGGDLSLSLEVPPPPPNDDIANATVVGGLPFQDTLDTASATTGQNPPDPDCFGNDHTVWYVFTPDTDGPFTVRTGTGPVSVYTGTPGQLTQIACAAQTEVTFEAQAGVTYFIMSASLEDFAGGRTFFSLFRHLELKLSLERQGSVSGATGVATVTGSVSCTAPVLVNDSPGVCVCGTLRQSRRFSITEASDCVCGDCIGEMPFTLTFSDPETPFVGGRAGFSVEASGCTHFECDSEQLTRELRLRGNSP